MSLDHFVDIYRHRAKAYHALIAAEDVEGNLLNALKHVTALNNSNILDLGSGTGRIHLLIRNRENKIMSLDLHREMLREQAVQREAIAGKWLISQADLRQLPIADNWADLVMAGWAIGHFPSWHAAHWQEEVDGALAEMQRAAKPHATIVILETMGTGTESAGPPSPSMADYYSRLEEEHDFQRQTISTDYEFANLAEAVELIGFFFGEKLAAKVRANNWRIVPEWTGIWHKKVQ